ncbi:hypothetical protein [uncultured Clostridium sp.]|uniref:hypothetical protein n=1 Tax=uncultured Clostridium sp. TaxID=59620 RepID=UPI0025FB28E6|nr:hypothetical protein [uncultured Clostridium sp.]
MNELIENTLAPLGLTVNYLEREDKIFPQVVYYFKEYSNACGDNKVETDKYDIYFNLYIKKNISSTIKNIKKALGDNKFIKIVVNPPEKFKGLDYYQVTMNYKKIMISE